MGNILFKYILKVIETIFDSSKKNEFLFMEENIFTLEDEEEKKFEPEIGKIANFNHQIFNFKNIINENVSFLFF